MRNMSPHLAGQTHQAGLPFLPHDDFKYAAQ
jgi:hypothetical protein